MASARQPFSISRLRQLTDQRPGRGAVRAAALLAGGLWLAGLLSPDYLLPGSVVGAKGLAAVHEHEAPVVLAPGYADLNFTPPAAGSYALPPLGNAVDGTVLDSQGSTLALHDLMGDRLVLLSFIYTSCSDANGCPLASHVFAQVAERLSRDGQRDGLSESVRLISLSFDPDHDSPAVMRAYGSPFQERFQRRFQQENVDWRFLTSSGRTTLDPILEGYGQWVIRDYDEAGEPLPSMSHLLRVFLIDREKRVRNIYSVSFLHADTIANDLMTLLMETTP